MKVGVGTSLPCPVVTLADGPGGRPMLLATVGDRYIRPLPVSIRNLTGTKGLGTLKADANVAGYRTSNVMIGSIPRTNGVTTSATSNHL